GCHASRSDRLLHPGGSAAAHRLLWLPSGRPPVSVKIPESHERIVMDVVRFDASAFDDEVRLLNRGRVIVRKRWESRVEHAGSTNLVRPVRFRLRTLMIA